MKIGVFDSGIGGLSVARAIERAFPEAEVLYINDAANVPYGTKTPERIYELAYPKVAELYKKGCDPIVLACNTLTATNKPRLEQAFPVRFIGLEPMVKPAARQTKSGKVIICATPATLASARYRQLKNDFADGIDCIEPDCSDWASLIEANEITEEKIKSVILPGLDAGADIIVLACTHYHWIEQAIITIADGRAMVLQPEQAVIRRIASLRDSVPLS
jgi:glutamate racemase